MRLCLRRLRLCLRLRGWGPVNDGPARPSRDQQAAQAAWLAPLRSRALRRVRVGARRAVLDLGAGHGIVTEELVRRCGGLVVAVDREPTEVSGARVVRAEATALPFPTGSFDLVFCQLSMMWMPLEAALDEVHRVLSPGGAFVALEPDYGGLLEHPPQVALRPVWEAALARAGADPAVARRLPGALVARGFSVDVLLPTALEPPSTLRFDLLAGLPLLPDEERHLEEARRAAAALSRSWGQLAFLPVLAICATLPDRRP